MIRKLILIVFVSVILCTGGRYLYSQDDPVRPGKGVARPLTIYMILWRGITDAEKGFMDQLVNEPREGETGPRNINFIVRDCQGHKAPLESYRKEIKQIRPDLIYTFGTTITAYIAGTVDDVRDETFIHNIPIVFCIVNNPLGSKLITNLERPGQNLTGASHTVPLLIQVERMKAIFDIKRLAVIYNEEEAPTLLTMEELAALADKNGFELIKVPLPLDSTGKLAVSRLPASMARCIEQKPDLVFLPSDSMVIKNVKTLMELILVNGLPSFSATEPPIREAGALMGVVGPYYEVGKYAGMKAEEILFDGKVAGDIPIRMLPSFTFLVNTITFIKLNITIPEKIFRSVRFTDSSYVASQGK